MKPREKNAAHHCLGKFTVVATDGLYHLSPVTGKRFATEEAAKQWLLDNSREPQWERGMQHPVPARYRLATAVQDGNGWEPMSVWMQERDVENGTPFWREGWVPARGLTVAA